MTSRAGAAPIECEVMSRAGAPPITAMGGAEEPEPVREELVGAGAGAGAGD